jgi:DNA processing protein
VTAGPVATASAPLLGAAGEALPEEAYGAALAGLDAMTPRRLHALVESGAPLEEVWAALCAGSSARVPVLRHLVKEGSDLLPRWQRAALAVDVAELWSRCSDQQVVVLGRPGYPDALVGDPLPPAVLFVKGDLGLLDRRIVAIVGTRHATVGGMEVAARLGRDLAVAGVSVVSGLAKGIDGAAHRGALEADGGAPPIAVVGSGLDVVYPRSNRGLWDAVAARGLLCSEVPPGTPPAAHRFPARNRILAGLAELLVVVESRVRGGSLLTVGEASRRGLTVMAVPGSVRSPASEGTNLLLVDGATPVLDATDVLVTLGLQARPAQRRRADRRPPPDPADRGLLDLLGSDALTLDTLVLRSGRALTDVAVALGRLEAAGWVVRAGAWFERAHAGGAR